jgi:hypothetical protein
MAGISYSLPRGVSGFKISDFTIGTSTPGSGDLEFRMNTTDTNSATLTRKDAILFLQAVIRALESGPTFSTAPPL